MHSEMGHTADFWAPYSAYTIIKYIPYLHVVQTSELAS